MARIRTVKPEFFKSDELAELPFEYRLLFQGLWCLADRRGRLEDRPKRIKAEIFPYDDVDCEAGLQALADAGFIVRYGHGGTRYLQVTNFEKHQNCNVKEAESTIPALCEHGADTGLAPEGHTTVGKEGKGTGREGIPYGNDADAVPGTVAEIVQPGDREPWATVAGCLNRVAELLEVSPPTESQIRQHLKETSHLRQLVARHGTEKTAQMFVWASSHFRQRVTWAVLWNAEADVLAKMKSDSGKAPKDHLARIVAEAEALGA